MKPIRKLIIILLAAMLVFTASACTFDPTNISNTETDTNTNTAEPETPPEFTLDLSTTALASDWNPHTWKTAADSQILGLITSPLVDITVKDPKAGTYQWIYEMAESVKDVTADHKEDLVKYGVFAEGMVPENLAEGYVYEIKLNKNAKWKEGEPITADDYIYSMQKLLDPQLNNYRAGRFISGNAALAGAYNYFNSGNPVYIPMVKTDLGIYFDYERGVYDGVVYINVDSSDYEFNSLSLAEINSTYKAGLATELEMLRRQADEYGYTQVTADNKAMVENVVVSMLNKVFGINDQWQISNGFKEALFVRTGVFEEASFDTVGLYKADSEDGLTLIYVCAQKTDMNSLFQLLSDNWLVNKDLYEKGRNDTNGYPAVDYGSSAANTACYGPYMISSVSEGKIELVQNPEWYGWEEQEDGSLISHTGFEIGGEKKQQYKTTKIIIEQMDGAQAEAAFDEGRLSRLALGDSNYSKYAESEKLYSMDETFTWSLFFNANSAYLMTLDDQGDDSNAMVLSNLNFRRAFSLCIDRAEFAGTTPGYTPALGLLDGQYYYDAYNDPSSSYRNTEQAKAALVELYEVEYGEDKEIKTLDEAYKTITGHDLEKAKELMKTAHDELVAANRYTDDEPIKIRMAYKSGELNENDKKQIELLNKYINAAAEGSGFGEIELEGVGGIKDRSSAVNNGEFAIGCGAWGGAALFPFNHMQVYCDPDRYRINEAADWDPKTETLTMTLDQWLTTKTWQEWSLTLDKGGIYENQPNELKLYITSVLEKEFLKKYFRIPVASSAAYEVLSERLSYFTDDYSIFYGFGGIRLLDYSMNDKEWAAYLEEKAAEKAAAEAAAEAEKANAAENEVENTENAAENEAENTENSIENEVENTENSVENEVENTENTVENETENSAENTTENTAD